MSEQVKKHNRLAELNLSQNHTWGLQRLDSEDSQHKFRWIPIAPISGLLETFNSPNAPKYIVEPKPMDVDFFAGNYSVYKAYEPLLERLVLLKIAATENVEINKETVERLENEYSLLKTTDRPGLPKVYELISTQLELMYSLTRIDKQSIPILVMELLPGPRLDYELANLSKEQIIKTAAEIASTVDYLNLKVGKPHGDIKSANVILAPEHSKVIDLGNTNGGLFSTYYSAPELAAGVKPNHASDIYSTAVVFYEMLRGGVPFQIEYDIEHGREIDPASKRVYKPLTVENCAKFGLDNDQVTALNILFEKVFGLPTERPKSAEQLMQEFQTILN